MTIETRMLKKQIAGETRARLAAKERLRQEEIRADAAEKRERELHAELRRLRLRVSELEAAMASLGRAA